MVNFKVMHFLNFSDEFCSCKLVISTLRHFVIYMENEPIVERGARFCTALTSARVLSSKSRIKLLLLSFSHLLVKSGVCERSELSFPYLSLVFL